MRRAVIYVRYSTDLQSERSVADQIGLCRQYASREELSVLRAYEDKALSGASTMNRPGLHAMLSDASAGRFEVVVVEALDRLSRDMEDLAGIHKRLQFYGVEIKAVHEGRVDTVLIGLRGLVGQLYREDNVNKIRRGLSGRVKQGLSAGGSPYGYRPDPTEKGRLLVREDEANIVRRIFNEFISGNSPRSIAQRLNRDRIPPPRGRNWNASTINGNLERGTGILNNRLYCGQIVWNKVRMIRDPDTGRRVSRPNPQEQREIVEVPDYRILPEGQFEQVAVFRSRVRHLPAEKHRRPKRILSGLLRCEACGSGMTTCGKDKSGRARIRCSAARESGTCPDPKTYYLDVVETLVIDAVLGELQKPTQCARFVEVYVAERRRLVAQSVKARSNLEKKIAQRQREIDRIIDAVAGGFLTKEDIGNKVRVLREEQELIRNELETVPPVVDTVALHPVALRRYEEKLINLRGDIQRGLDDGNGADANAIRDLLDTVVVRRGSRSTVNVRISGKLNALVAAPGLRSESVDNGGSGGGI